MSLARALDLKSGDFIVGKAGEEVFASVRLEWRGTKSQFWTINPSSDGPFHEGQALTVDQARAVRSALNELERRLGEGARP